MLILAIEQSTPTAGIALLNDATPIGETEWTEPRFRNPPAGGQLFVRLADLLKTYSVAAADIDLFAVGLGPGSFSGLRIALAAAQGLALPDRKRVFGISSGEALAWDLLSEAPLSRVAVVGDARRQRFWYAAFEREPNGPRMTAAYSLLTADDLSRALSASEIIATSDWDRIGETLAQAMGNSPALIRKTCVPRAHAIGELAFRRQASNRPSDSLTPIYLHPPVLKTP